MSQEDVEISLPVLLAQARQGERSALARLLSIVENDDHHTRALDSLLPIDIDSAGIIGVTGAPGAGKSTLTCALISECLEAQKSVAVLAVDPSSPVSAGAILGDRVRMHAHFLDARVYVRSLATRGCTGGLTRAIPQAIRLLDATGWQVIIVETVGVGQIELDVAGLVDTTLVVVNPGWGDAVQTYKAGLMEIADLFVINKADKEGVSKTRADIQSLISSRESKDWQPAILETIATTRSGCKELWQAISTHRRYLEENQLLEVVRKRRIDYYFKEVLDREIRKRVESVYHSDESITLRQQLHNGDVYSAVELLLSRLHKH